MQHLPYFLPPSESAGAVRADVPATGRPYFLFVGRLVKIKGAQMLIEAFRRYPHADLLLAGDGEYEPELRRLADGLDHVRFLGRIQPDELGRLYRGAIALLVPALVYETFGFITLESLGQRTPVIARDLGAVAEVVKDTGGGITYQTEQELLDAMTLLQSNRELRDELGNTGHRSYTERYSEETHVRAYLDAIERAGAARSLAEPAAI
jgi:glycosyltransferase involved in cell wall biosynthesis